LGYYAAYLDLGGKRCVVVGGGAPALDKVRGLLDAGAAVTVVATETVDELAQLARDGIVDIARRPFDEHDLDGCALVIDASGDDASGEKVATAARARGVLVNVLDRVPWCDFIAPAMVRRGPLQVAISTSGRSPFFASFLRRRLEAELGPEWGELVEMTGRLRDRLRAGGVPLEEQSRIYARIPECGALEHLREGRGDLAQAALEACAS
jgi:precorrin-2 dehydrogenase/sirohydrochlorin ferrochelatase